MVKPNLFICGVHKGGTTSLHNYLGQHPKIFMSDDKEPRYFSLGFANNYGNGPNDPVNTFKYNDINEYLSIFNSDKSATYFGESSTIYMSDQNVPKRIYEYNSSSKIIVIIRNPYERIFSNYLYNLQNGIENYNLFDSLESEKSRIEKGWGPVWHYKTKSLYSDQITQFKNLFGNNLKVIKFEDFKNDADTVLRDIFDFLKLEYAEIDTKTKHNITYQPQSASLNRMLRNASKVDFIYKFIPKKIRQSLKKRIQKVNRSKKTEEIDSSDKNLSIQFLKNDLNRDIKKLMSCIDCDLSNWMK